MDYSDYLREQAAKYRQLAETAKDPSVKREILELAAVCEEVANEIDDRRTSGRINATGRNRFCRRPSALRGR